MRAIVISTLLALAAVIVWVYTARSLSLLVDRLHRHRISSQPIDSLRFDSGTIRVAGIGFYTTTPKILPSGLDITLDASGRAAFDWHGRKFPCGPGRSLPNRSGLVDIEFTPDPGDTVTLIKERSILSWPTPFEMNFMTGVVAHWRRHLYARLQWTKRSGARIEMEWIFDQGYYTERGWYPRAIEYGAAGLQRVTIKDARDLEKAAVDYLARTRRWPPTDYRLELRGPAADGSGEIIAAIHREDERNPEPGGGLSLQLVLDYSSRKVTREIAFQ